MAAISLEAGQALLQEAYRSTNRTASTPRATTPPKTTPIPATTPADDAPGHRGAVPSVKRVVNVDRTNGGGFQPDPVSAAPRVPPNQTPPNTSQPTTATTTIAHGANSCGLGLAPGSLHHEPSTSASLDRSGMYSVAGSTGGSFSAQRLLVSCSRRSVSVMATWMGIPVGHRP